MKQSMLWSPGQRWLGPCGLGPGSLALTLLWVGGCTNDLGPQPVLPVARAVKSAAARPLDAGLLSVSADGAFALASDSIGGAAYVITLSAEALTSRKVSLEPGDEPGRAALSSTRAYVTLPRSGAVAEIDLESASMVGRSSPCPSPQSVAVDGESLHVACRGGELVTTSLADGHVERSLTLDDDLRDVVVVASGLVVSTFAKAELLWLDPEGALIERTVPLVSLGSEPAVAWRTLLAPDGRVLVAHQTDSDQDLGSSYSGGDCGSIAAPTVTGFSPPGVLLPGSTEIGPSSMARVVSQMSMSAGAGTFDVAVAGGEMILVFPGNEFARRFAKGTSSAGGNTPVDPAENGEAMEVHSIQRFVMGQDDTTCRPSADNMEDEPAAPIGITAASAGPLAGRALVLTHSPAAVKVLGSDLAVELHAEDRESAGLELFQMTVGSGVACASCHPGGRADARTWKLHNGPRRTQPLEGGVSQLGAFHWDAEFDDFSDLLDDVMTDRMGLHEVLSAGHKSALLTFLDAIPTAPNRITNDDAEAIARGEALFGSATTQCVNCHGGSAFTNNSVVDVGTGGTFVTPSLVGVGYRRPLMHDGCASDLLERFGPCGGGDAHGRTSQLTEGAIADLVAYMKTL